MCQRRIFLVYSFIQSHEHNLAECIWYNPRILFLFPLIVLSTSLREASLFVCWGKLGEKLFQYLDLGHASLNEVFNNALIMDLRY